MLHRLKSYFIYCFFLVLIYLKYYTCLFRARPKQRPDWNNLLQEIESKKKLKHVVCNDRSSPILPEAKTPDEHFLYKSEEPNVHNELLKQVCRKSQILNIKYNTF